MEYTFLNKILPQFSIILSMFFLTTPVFADDDDKKEYTQLLNEVFRTELVYPQAKGEVQISFAPMFFNQRDQKNVIFPLLLEYGLTDAWQIDLFADIFIVHYPKGEPRTTGHGDMGIGTKYSFMNINQSNYSASLNFDITFPTANIDKGLTDGFRIYEPSISLAKDFPTFHNTQLFSQLGFEFLQRVKKPRIDDTEQEEVSADTEEVEPQAHSFFFNIGYIIPSGIARYVIEMNWETNRWNHGGEDNELYLTPGIVWVPSKYWEFAIGGSIGLNKSSDPYDIFLRATYEIVT